MSGTAIKTASGAEIEEVSQYNDLPTPPPDKEPSIPQKESFFKKILTARTGDGSIDNYISHPLNFNGQEGTARIIRGATGILGNLDLAIIDITFGLLEFAKPKKGGTGNSVGL